ncbi:MAG: hypothetical protein AAGD88_13420 [Bacteroidota bacterium]
MKCKLCLAREADKTGSHIVPAFILKTLFERNKEFVVSISDKDVANHVGRELTPEKIKEYMGRDLSDKEIEKNHIPFIEDYILCSICENRIGHLESLYASRIHAVISKKECEIDEIADFGKDGFLVSLFWYSVIWRYSISTKNPFSLKIKNQKSLRNYLDRNLQSTIQGLEEHISGEPECINYPIGVFFNSNAVIKSSSNPVFGLTQQANPYFLFFNEYVVILFFKDSQIKGIKHTFFGLEKSFEYTEHINTNGKALNIGVIKNSVWEDIKAKVFQSLAKMKHQEFVQMFSFIANHYNLDFNKKHIKIFIDRILNDDTTFADRYDKGRVLEILKEELIKIPIKVG